MTKSEKKKRGLGPGLGTKPIGEKPMTTAQKKQKERADKKNFGLQLISDFWFLPEDQDTVEKIRKKARDKYKNTSHNSLRKI